MSSARFLNKFLQFNSSIVQNTPNIDITTKVQILSYTARYFTLLQNDFTGLNAKVEQLQKELNETKTKLENGCGCYCKNQ